MPNTLSFEQYLVNIWSDIAFTVAGYQSLAYHQNHCIHIVVSINKPFVIHLDNGVAAENLKFAVIPKNTLHCIDTQGARVMVVSVEPVFLDARFIHEAPKFIGLGYIPQTLKHLNHDVKLGDNRKVADKIFDFVKTCYLEQQVLDPRITDVILEIRKATNSQPSLQSLLDSSYLSSSQMQRLFSKSIGMTIRRYSLWYRLHLAFDAIVSGQSPQEAAFKTGFSDYPHFCNNFKAMLGISPQRLLKPDNGLFLQSSGFYSLEKNHSLN